MLPKVAFSFTQSTFPHGSTCAFSSKGPLGFEFEEEKLWNQTAKHWHILPTRLEIPELQTANVRGLKTFRLLHWVSTIASGSCFVVLVVHLHCISFFSGPAAGLKLLLDVQQYDYMKSNGILGSVYEAGRFTHLLE